MMEIASRTSRNTIIVRGNLIPYHSPLSTKTYTWLLVSKLTARKIHHSHSVERSFFILLRFYLIEPRWFFIRGGKWHKPNLCTVQIHTLGAPGIRPDARRVSKARRLVEPRQKVTWHTRHTIRATWHTRHIIALSQDCSRGLHSCVSARYVGHSARHTPTKIFGPIDTLCGNLHWEHC